MVVARGACRTRGAMMSLYICNRTYINRKSNLVKKRAVIKTQEEQYLSVSKVSLVCGKTRVKVILRSRETRKLYI
jgi:hypothetical protein